jgi:hypothetical protein
MILKKGRAGKELDTKLRVITDIDRLRRRVSFLEWEDPEEIESGQSYFPWRAAT